MINRQITSDQTSLAMFPFVALASLVAAVQAGGIAYQRGYNTPPVYSAEAAASVPSYGYATKQFGHPTHGSYGAPAYHPYGARQVLTKIPYASPTYSGTYAAPTHSYGDHAAKSLTYESRAYAPVQQHYAAPAPIASPAISYASPAQPHYPAAAPAISYGAPTYGYAASVPSLAYQQGAPITKVTAPAISYGHAAPVVAYGYSKTIAAPAALPYGAQVVTKGVVAPHHY